MKVLILDSGILINLSMNGLLYIIEKLKETSKIKIFITKEVKYETVERPIKVPRFELGALRIQSLIDSKIIEFPYPLISENELKIKTQELMDTANHYFQSKGKWIKIVSDAEMSCLALSSILTKNKIQNIIGIDERTTRILAEKPQNLERIMSKKLHENIKLSDQDFSIFKEFPMHQCFKINSLSLDWKLQN